MCKKTESESQTQSSAHGAAPSAHVVPHQPILAAGALSSRAVTFLLTATTPGPIVHYGKLALLGR